MIIAEYRNYAVSSERRERDRDLWDKFWKDKNGKTVIYQHPNVFIIAWAVLDLVAIFVPSKNVTNIAYAAATVALVLWALLEIFRGVNYFRRLLGAVVLLMAVAMIFRVL